MLDRFPTELISLVIDETATGAWQRKALIDSLSSVSKGYRNAMRPLRESIVHVPKASVIPLLRSWPMATRKAVDAVFVGSSDQAKAFEPFTIRDYSRLLSILPKIKHIYLQRVGDQYEWPKKRFHPCQMWFELNSFNPFKQCFSLSLRQSLWHFPPTLETARFKLRRLRVELVLTGPGPEQNKGWGDGLDQFLTTQFLPCLRELHLLCQQLPKISADFINQLDAAQIDFCQTTDVENSGISRNGPFSAPVLFSFHAHFFFSNQGRQLWGVQFAHLRAEISWDLGLAVRFLPQLKGLSFQISNPEISTDDLVSLDHRFSPDTIKRVEDASIELFAAGNGNDDFVDSGFLRFLGSRRTRT